MVRAEIPGRYVTDDELRITDYANGSLQQGRLTSFGGFSGTDNPASLFIIVDVFSMSVVFCMFFCVVLFCVSLIAL